MRPQSMTPLALLALLAITGCGSEAKLLVEDGIGPDPKLPTPEKSLIPDRQYRAGRRLGRGATPVAAEGTAGRRRSPTGSTIRAGSTCCRTATCSSPRPNAPRAARGRARASGASFMKQAMKQRGRRRAERESHHAAARRGWRRRRRDALRVPHGPELAVRHGARRQRPLRREHRCVVRFPYRDGDTTHPRRAGARSRTCPAARSIITGPRTSSRAATARSSTSTVGSNSNVAENGMDKEVRARRDSRDRRADRQRARVRFRTAQSERPRVGAGDAARCGPSSTSATSSAATSCPTT